MVTDDVQVKAGMCHHLLCYPAPAQLLSVLLSTRSNLILDVRLNCLDGCHWGWWCDLLATFEVVNEGSHQKLPHELSILSLNCSS